MPIRIRLILWYTFLLGVILVTFGTLLYAVLSYTLREQVDRNLQDRAQQVGNQLSSEARFVETGKVVLPDLNVFSSPAIFIQVINTEGKVVTATENVGKRRFPNHSEINAINNNGQAVYKTVMIDDTPIRVYSAPIIVGPPSQVVGAVQVGQSMKTIETTLQMMLLFLISGIVIALVIAALVGAFLAWTALRPIDKVTQTAAQIVSAQDLKQRLPIPKTNDEISRLTSTINNMLERLDKFFQAQIRLSADVSHELRTPLTAIRGNVDLLRRGAANDPAELSEALSIIDGELDRMSRIVADLLLLSQADAGLSLRLEPVELDTVVLEVYRQARVIANGIPIHLGHEDQAIVRGDPDRLKQLLINLMTNAIKHTPFNGSITLSLYRDKEWVRVTVADTGRGIAPTALPHIFERFYQAQDSENQSGSGLGLSIAQWIAKAHGGEITVTSELGKGSTFTLWLPNILEKPNTKPVEVLATEDAF
ncbi:MAG: HAMP domain-containing protein [Anaerolineae bacterium]|nr:HAMP domain-containing protein [Anaerolineae bacterium]MCB9109237.1 HAMP domain-containing protein [Anaerolineales bacterium]